jgi:hypothetical protein
MAGAWIVEDGEGQLMPGLTGATRLEVARKVVPRHYDAFRLHVSSSYREMLCRDLAKVLALKDWRVVRARPERRKAKERATQLELKLH